MIDISGNTTYFQDKKRRRLITGMVITGMILLFSIVSLLWTPYDVDAMDPTVVFQGPTIRHVFGTDNYGRDIFSRVMAGSGVTFLVALITVIVGMLIGTVIGAVSGYAGGIVDQFLSRVTDILMAFPSVLLALIMISLLGKGDLNIAAALSITMIPRFVRIVRGEIIRNKEKEFVMGARAIGISEIRILFRHVLPCADKAVLSAVGIGFTNAILSEAGMSFLGLGVQPPTPSLGRMLSEAQEFMISAPWYALGTGAWIILMILGFYLISEGIDTEAE